MKVSVPSPALKRIARWSQVGLWAVAVAMLGYCGFVVADGWLYQRQASRVLDLAHPDLAHPDLPHPDLPHPVMPSATQASTTPVRLGEMLGRMEIPRLGLSVMVAEGTSTKTLRRAAGHIEGTQWPGPPGNVGIAGHRDTLFRPLRNVRNHDLIVLTTLQGVYRYRVVSAHVVGPNDVAVLKDDGHSVLTLVTCYPFYFVGPAPDRFIVRAERIS